MKTLRALMLVLVCAACAAGKQTLGYELGEAADAGAPDAARDFSGDTHLRWYGGPAYHARWPNGLPSSVGFVPIGVWMQNPDNAARHRDVGINLFLGLWEGPTDAQLDALNAAELSTVCSQSGVWQSRADDPAMRGWLNDSSPDNAQELADGSYGPCIEPEVVQADYARMTAADDTRPVMLLLGQAVADAEWPGRGSCDGRDETYPEYAQAADVLGFYFYPVNRARPLELIATGVERLLAWSSYEKPLIVLVEASSIDGAPRPTPAQMRAEAWLALVRGAAGIAWYCHQFMPELNETDCLDDAATRDSLASINSEITSLAPALNSPMVGNGVELASDAPIATRLSRVGGTTYLFAVALSSTPTTARFSLRAYDQAEASVIGEARTLAIEAGAFTDDFDGYGVHLYRIER